MPEQENSQEDGSAMKNGYATLLTRPSYLAGAILLAYSLHAHSPSTPLMILYTPSTLPDPFIKALKSETEYSNIVLQPVEHLCPLTSQSGKENGGNGMVAERFIDTWTKLRVFSVQDVAFEKICFLDADMLVLKDPSPLIFDLGLGENEILATHVCVCNLDHDAWAPEDWKPENCAYSSLSHNSPPPAVTNDPPTHGIMNTGAFVF